jgi:hypothetical protein
MPFFLLNFPDSRINARRVARGGTSSRAPEKARSTSTDIDRHLSRHRPTGQPTYTGRRKETDNPYSEQSTGENVSPHSTAGHLLRGGEWAESSSRGESAGTSLGEHRPRDPLSRRRASERAGDPGRAREGFRLPPLPQNELRGAASRLRRGAGLFLEPLPEPLPSNLSGNFERLDALHLCLEGLGRVPEVHRALRVEPKLRRVLSSARREDPKAARIRRERSRRSGARGGGRQRRA